MYKQDSAFIALTVANNETDTILLRQYGQFEYEWIEFTKAGTKIQIGGSAKTIKKGLCEHFKPEYQKPMKKKLDKYPWIRVGPGESASHLSFVCVMEKNTKLSKVIPYKSFIYKFNKQLDNYQPCPQEPVEEKYHWKR